MTETPELKEKGDASPQAIETFVLNWGDLGNKWGVSRSINQIHAFLYLADKPMTAEQIAVDLEMACSNVSNSAKELLNWRLIFRVPVRGDRRNHFLAETDVWEIDPARNTLRTCLNQANKDPRISAENSKNCRRCWNSLNRWTAGTIKCFSCQSFDVSHC